MMNFVNIAWFVSIVGIVCTIIPFIVKLLLPLKDIFAGSVSSALLAMHRNGVFSMVGFYFCLCLVVQGSRYPPGYAHSAVMVSLSGAMGFAPCIVYSLSLLSRQEETGMRQITRIAMLYCLLVLAPLAVFFQSPLMGFLSCIALFDLCGFGIRYMGIGYEIGFEVYPSSILPPLLSRYCRTARTCSDAS